MSRISPLFEVCRYSDAIVYQRPLDSRRMAEHAKKRVLVVDDAGLVRRYYRDILETRGLRGRGSPQRPGGDGEAAAAAGRSHHRRHQHAADGRHFVSASILRRQTLPLAAIPALVASTEAGAQDIGGGSRRRRQSSIWSSRCAQETPRPICRAALRSARHERIRRAIPAGVPRTGGTGDRAIFWRWRKIPAIPNGWKAPFAPFTP